MALDSLNLKEHTSGTTRFGLHLTKRGPGIARLFLYMAALRAIQQNEVVAAWYTRKVRRQGGLVAADALAAEAQALGLHYR